MKIAVIGGGWMGMVLSKRLADQDHSVHIFEREAQLGGLTTYYDYGEFYWDKFYHVILPGDAALLGFIKEVGLEAELRWKETFTGVYVDDKFHSVSNSKEFLLFPPLNMFQKFRLAMTILIGARINDWKKMETMTSEDWLIKYSGKTTYEKFWRPLLTAKLGDSYKEASAVFIWSYIKRLFEARGEGSSKKEAMGYVAGGYKTVIEKTEEVLQDMGVNIHLQTTVEAIRPHGEGGIEVKYGSEVAHFDKVVFTGPVNVLEKVVDKSLVQVSGRTDTVQYMGVACMIIATEKPITPYYVLNIADQSIPFTGVIGMSTLVDTAETGGYYLTYLPKYINSKDEFLRKSDGEIQEIFFEGLFRMYPDLSREDIKRVWINRAFKVQPLQVLNYSEIIPKTSTLHPDFYVLNTSQFIQGTLNNNSVTSHVNKFVEQFGEELKKGSPSQVLNN
ncbi:MAG: NAD(P)/FAD-dependent oxidoreductase [Bacteroidia bacterium]|nr:NAD(P)/FAD-dependent oxidoreductase [Bacteroidia bacterium]